MTARIVVSRRIPEPALELLAESGDVWLNPHRRALSREELLSAVRDADAIVTLLHDRVDAELAEAAGPRLRVVANVAVGYDNIDVDALTARNVHVTNTPGVLTEATADIAFALLLAVTRRLGEGERLIRADQPWNWDMFFLLGTGIQEKTLGIVGLGQIGQAMARRARACGMRIIYTQRHRASAELEATLDARYVTLDEVLTTADVVSLHCPLTPETLHLIAAEQLSQMRRSAFLINTTRGPVVDEQALADALCTGVIAGAGLDVYEHEPVVHAGLLALDNVVLLPHLGSATVETRTAMGMLAARNVAAVLAGDAPLTPLN